MGQQRTFFSQEHEAFREQVRRFCEQEIAPAHTAWEAAHGVPQEIWRRAGANGLLCCWLTEDDGGPGGDLLFDVIVAEELSRIGATGPGFNLHSMVVAPYIVHYGSPAIRQAVLPQMVSGELIGAIAMTEPGTGSDLAGIRTRAVRDGADWLLSGQKTFITNGQNAGVIVVAARTENEAGKPGISLFVVTADMAGFSRGRNLHKIGQHAQDTAELYFENVRVPASHLLGEVNHGFRYMMRELPQERLCISVNNQARAEAIFEWTREYVKERKAFGQRIADFQNTRFKLAALWADLQAGRALCDSMLQRHLEGALDTADASAGKLWHSEMLGRLADECLQLHGGYGYMQEYAVARAWCDARIERIYAGTSEIMKEIIARAICDEPR
uniref:acyl-CoA dehydrogenase family protein n=1 Tax=Castellaniella defragrans TaxID=75697 RepID=UPI0033414547